MGEVGLVNIGPSPPSKFQTLFNKNAIKPKMTIFPESLDPLGIWAKTSGSTPSPRFSTRVHLWLV
jgi:hypothetical protein